MDLRTAFYKLGENQAANDFEKRALSWEALEPATQGAIKRMGQGAAVGLVPGAAAGYAMSDEHPVLGTLGGAAAGSALGAAGGYAGGKALENAAWNKSKDILARNLPKESPLSEGFHNELKRKGLLDTDLRNIISRNTDDIVNRTPAADSHYNVLRRAMAEGAKKQNMQ